MAETPDRRAFEVVTGRLGNASPEFRAAARAVATADTLATFLDDLRARYPEMHNVLPGTPGQIKDGDSASSADPTSTGATQTPRRRSARR
jgi:hypothetical protein